MRFSSFHKEVLLEFCAASLEETCERLEGLVSRPRAVMRANSAAFWLKRDVREGAGLIARSMVLLEDWDGAGLAGRECWDCRENDRRLCDLLNVESGRALDEGLAA